MHIPQKNIQHLHFIGIGGIGMSGIAEVLHNLGYKVKGSDLNLSYNTERLKKIGIEVSMGHHEANIKDAQVVIVSSAVDKNNPEILAARKADIPVIQRVEMLAEITRLKRSIAVSGTHGKTTTTSLIAALLDFADLDPTVINGGIINAYNTNARLGTGEWSVVEADESDGSFTKLSSTIAIITNIEAEHMEFYKTYDSLKKSFIHFVQNIPFYGLSIVCSDNPTVSEIMPCIQKNRRVLTYGLNDDAMVQAFNIEPHEDGITFSAKIKNNLPSHFTANSKLPHQMHDLFLPMIGRFNVSNALAVIGVAMELGISYNNLKRMLSNFRGVKRRFTKVGEFNGINIFDDYAHHPTEIDAVLCAAKEAYPSSKIIAIVQPHRFSRLHNFFGEFANTLMKADQLIITPVYSAGENPIPTSTSSNLAQSIREIGHKNTHEVLDISETASIIHFYAKPNDIVIFMGAGNITQWSYSLCEELSKFNKNSTLQIVNQR